jgi:DNA-binding NarL/FixJ family response regulator
MYETTVSQITNGAIRATLRLLVVTRYRLDGEALAALFHAHTEFRVLSATTSLDVAATVCRHRRPDVVVMGADLIDGLSCRDLRSFVRPLGDVPILVLDAEVHEGRLSAVLELPVAGYFTRGASHPELVEGVRRLARGERSFESGIESYVLRSSAGRRFCHAPHASPLGTLTSREMEVLRLTALGNTVKACAEILKLAPSTVDNHKSRLMKKLGVHKSLDLTRLAIREGLISL